MERTSKLVTELYGWLFLPLTYFVDKFWQDAVPGYLTRANEEFLKLLSCFMRECEESKTIGTDVPVTVEGYS